MNCDIPNTVCEAIVVQYLLGEAVTLEGKLETTLTTAEREHYMELLTSVVRTYNHFCPSSGVADIFQKHIFLY